MMQTYTAYLKRLTDKFLKVCSWIASCQTNGQIDNLEYMVLPWFQKTRCLYRALVNKMQVQRALIAAYPETPAGWSHTDDATPGESDPTDLNKAA